MTNAKMRAITKPSGRIGLVLKNVPVPETGPRDVRVRLLATSICGSDLHIYDNDPTFLGRVKDGNVDIGMLRYHLREAGHVHGRRDLWSGPDPRPRLSHAAQRLCL